MSLVTQTTYGKIPVQPFLMRKGNYVFDTTLTLFGMMKQRIISKVNRRENILKLRNNESFDSIYPMLDEYGYMVVDFFIFKSTWDIQYYIESYSPKISSVPGSENIFQTTILSEVIKNYNSKNA